MPKLGKKKIAHTVRERDGGQAHAGKTTPRRGESRKASGGVGGTLIGFEPGDGERTEKNLKTLKATLKKGL